MYPKWLNRLADFFEEVVLWLVEGRKSPFGRKDPKRMRAYTKRYPE